MNKMFRSLGSSGVGGLSIRVSPRVLDEFAIVI